MKSAFSLLLVGFILLLSACSTSESEPDLVTGTPETIASSYMEDFISQDIAALLENYRYDDKMQKALSETLFTQLFAQLDAQYGLHQETGTSETSSSGIYTVVSTPTVRERADLNINLVFDPEGLIAGLNYTEILEAMTSQTAVEHLEVTFGNTPFELSGTLSLPTGEGPFPAVILIHGSGPSDRDESYLELAPFRDLALYLSDHGIAVLRFDKRSYTYQQEIDPETFTPYEESVEDAYLAFEYLAEQEAVDREQIFLLGHSLGGYLMPRIASLTPEAAGYIITAGSALPLEDLIVKQYTYIYGLDGTISDEEQATLDILSSQRDQIKAGALLPASELLGASHAYWQYLAEYHPLEEVKAIEQPMLFLQGEGDYQVTLDDFRLWSEATAEMPRVTRITYPEINHFLYRGEGIPGPQQYQSPGHVDEQLMNDIINFIQSTEN